MRSIGEMARESGLSVSALRFYDRAGVLVPSWVDPVSGYRWYDPGQLEEARLLARLRRAGMPLADIRLVLAGWSGADADLVRGLLRAHLRRLERGLSDARTEFSALRVLLDHRENPMTSLRAATSAATQLTVSAPGLAAALDAVRFAVCSDPELPVLAGVLFDLEDEELHVVATDRYRMAVARTHALADPTGDTDGHASARVQAVVPAPLVDAVRALLGAEGTVRFAVDGGQVRLEAGDRQVAGQCVDHDFPDYRRLVALPAGRRATVDVSAFRKALENGPVRAGETREPEGQAHDLSVLRVTDDGTLTLVEDGDDDQDNVAVNRAFLFDALTAGARDRLVVELGSPTAPLAVRRPEGDDEHAFSLLMPVRLEN